MTTHVCVEQIAVAPDFFLGLAVHDGCGSAVQLPVPDWSQRTGHRWTSTTSVRLTAPVLSAISARAARRKVEHKIIRVSRYQKGDADLDFTEQETVSGSGMSWWAVCKSAPCFRQITTPAPHPSIFTGRVPFLPTNQQRVSTEGKHLMLIISSIAVLFL